MNWQALLETKIQDFMTAHQDDDVKVLALKKPPEENWPYPLILDQIKSRQKARKKMPGWLDHKGIIFPPSELIEQASSNACALYKAAICKGQSFIDMTGGSGMDSFAFLQNFETGIATERNEQAAQILEHNAAALGLGARFRVLHGKAEDLLSGLDKTDLIYIDPQRRDEGRKGKFDLSSCEPDVITLLPLLKQKSDKVLLKTSPVLDIRKTLLDLEHVSQVHVVQYQGDCKELLFLLDFTQQLEPEAVKICALDVDSDGREINSLCFTSRDEERAQAELSLPLHFLYEPGPAFQKSGGFNSIAQRYDLKKLHRHTHLYTSETPLPDFPGRGFKVLSTVNANKKDIKNILPDMKANLTIRNFPSTPELLRKKLGLKDGGKAYLFACELFDGSKKIINCVKIEEN